MAEISVTQQSFLDSQKRHKRTVSIARVLILVIFLVVWEAASRTGLIDDFIFSSPSRVVGCFVGMIKDKSIFLHIGITLTETIVSFLLVILLSILMAILLWTNRKCSEILEPYLVVLNSLPKSALAPLLIVWLGGNMKTIIVAGLSVAIFGSIINLYTAFMEVSPDKKKLVYTLGGSKGAVLRKVVIPSSIPALISTMKVNIGLCLVGVVIGEFIGSKEGLGYLIIYGSQVFKLDWVIMSIVILCIIAMALYKLIGMIEKLYLRKL